MTNTEIISLINEYATIYAKKFYSLDRDDIASELGLSITKSLQEYKSGDLPLKSFIVRHFNNDIKDLLKSTLTDKNLPNATALLVKENTLISHRIDEVECELDVQKVVACLKGDCFASVWTTFTLNEQKVIVNIAIGDATNANVKLAIGRRHNKIHRTTKARRIQKLWERFVIMVKDIFPRDTEWDTVRIGLAQHFGI